MSALSDGTIKKGDVVVIAYEGPKGGPGMREMLMITSAIMSGLRKRCSASHRWPILWRYNRTLRRAYLT